MENIEKARKLAIERHAGQFRPNNTRESKIIHIAEVARLVKESGGGEVEEVSAWLHDIVEDTNTTIEEVRKLFGDEVAELVDGLSDPPEFAAMPLASRKTQQAERLAFKSNKVKYVKLCDQISNVHSVLNDPPLDWDNRKCLAYIEGAKKIAEICSGLSDHLDTLFEKYYLERVKYL